MHGVLRVHIIPPSLTRWAPLAIFAGDAVARNKRHVIESNRHSLPLMAFNEKEQPVTIEHLAAMTARGFEDVHAQLNLLATKVDLAELKAEFKENIQALHQD